MSKPMLYSCKKRKLLSNAYYLPKDKFNEMIIELEHYNEHRIEKISEENGLYVEYLDDMQYCIHMVDSYGEWLH